MKNKKTVWLSAFKNVVPSDFEAWLEEEALQGWQVDKIGQWSSIRMIFKKGEAKKYRYVYDIQVIEKKDYKNIYAQFGWEFIGQMASAYIWRKEYTDQRAESFSDMQSIEDRNKRVVRAASVSFFIFVPAFLIALITLAVMFRSLSIGDIIQCVLFLLLSGGIASYIACVMRKIYKNRFK